MKLFAPICCALLVLGSERSSAVELDDSPVADCEFKSMFTLTKDVPTVRVRDFMGMCEDFVRSQRAMPP